MELTREEKLRITNSMLKGWFTNKSCIMIKEAYKIDVEKTASLAAEICSATIEKIEKEIK